MQNPIPQSREWIQWISSITLNFYAMKGMDVKLPDNKAPRAFGMIITKYYLHLNYL